MQSGVEAVALAITVAKEGQFIFEIMASGRWIFPNDSRERQHVFVKCYAIESVQIHYKVFLRGIDIERPGDIRRAQK
jgi:hypothetical protein